MHACTSRYPTTHSTPSEKMATLPRTVCVCCACQTDPNWGNFLYDHESDRIAVIDFGAARAYRKSFVDQYVCARWTYTRAGNTHCVVGLSVVEARRYAASTQGPPRPTRGRGVDTILQEPFGTRVMLVRRYFSIVWAAAQAEDPDNGVILKASTNLGFLTGDESPVMRAAHVAAANVMGEPFRQEVFDFTACDIPGRVAGFGEVFLKHRLTAPPQEVYSLHRKLMGAFTTCIKLQATVPARQIMQQVHRDYKSD